jgi:hypothetical protein
MTQVIRPHPTEIRMIISKTLGALIAVSGLTLLSAHTAVAAEPKAPQQVHTALMILASVYADMDRKLADKQFARLPHENQEFQDGSGAMRDAIANEPADFKTKVETALGSSLKAADHVAEVSKTQDAAHVKSAIDALAASMRTLNGLFPEALRAEPGSVPPPVHNGAPAGS